WHSQSPGLNFMQSHFLSFIGGLAFFFYGLYAMHLGLHTFAGDRLKGIIARTTQSRMRSFLTGIIVTFFLQSSSAVTVMTVGLASSGLITLAQSMAISLGAGIGTTFVVLIISVKSIMEYGIVILILGMSLKFFALRQKTKILGEVLFGFGFVFFGLNMMSGATEPLKSYPFIPDIFHFIENYPIWNFVIAAIITALVHSSGVVLGILISLAYAGSITLPLAVPMILGANMGTTFTAIMAGVKSKPEGQRTAWANLLLRVGAVLIIAPFLGFATNQAHNLNVFLLENIFHHDVTVSSEIALCHLYFNLFVAIVFLPLLPFGEKIVCWLIPTRKDETTVFGPRYLDDHALSTPSLAFAQVNRELLRMGEIVQDMFKKIIDLFVKYDLDLVENIESSDHKVDTLYRAIKFYMARLSFQNMKGEEVNYSIHLMTAVNELENIGDTIDKHLVRLTLKKWNRGATFSEEGWQELLEMHKGTAHMMELALAALASSSEELARKMRHYQQLYAEREGQIKISHLKRLNQGLKESIETSSIHLELQAIFYRINLSLLTMVNHLIPVLNPNPVFDEESTNSN
ncbi:MAG: Na/Pi-cotransporter II-related protein, partial [uncultured bacterium]